MSRSRALLIMVCLVFVTSARAMGSVATVPPAPHPAAEVEDFALLDQHGVFQRLTAYRDAKLVVLFTTQVGCPIVRASAAEVQRLATLYAPQGVRFLLLDAGSDDARADIAAEALSLGLTIPIAHDESQLVCEGLKATRTAEAIVVRTKDWTIAWRGPLDDRVGYETQKDAASRHWLVEALDAVLAGKPPLADADAVKGCAITYAAPRARARIDFATDVAPILQTHCTRCHQSGGIAPWAMSSHTKVAAWSDMIREVVRTRRMPPWGADHAYGAFTNDDSLSVAETRTLVHWTESGAPGSARDPLVDHPPKPVDEWPLGKPDLIITLPEQTIPATGTLPYRMLTARVTWTQDTWVRAVDLHPSNRKVMHHGFALLSEPREENGLNSFFASYVPGQDPVPFPKGTGKLLRAGTTLTFQFHYTTSGVAGRDTPRLGLYIAHEPITRELRVSSAHQTHLDLPPGARSIPAVALLTAPKPVMLYALSPHMHLRGDSMRMIAELPDGSSETLLSVPHYDLNWQQCYQLREPKALPAGTRIRCVGTFDNSVFNERNPDPTKRVHWGEQSWDEMFIGYCVYADAGP
jgi:peroxiredoxin